MKTNYRTIPLLLGLMTTSLWSLCGQEFFTALETPTNFSGVANLFVMTEHTSEWVDFFLGDSWDITIRLSAGVTSPTTAFAVVGPLDFQHHVLGLEPSTITVPAQPSLSFLPFTEPQWYEILLTGPTPADSLVGFPDFTYRVSGMVAYDGRFWFSWQPTVELQVVPEVDVSALLALGACWLLFGRRHAGATS
jgi:hypothetical protein